MNCFMLIKASQWWCHWRWVVHQFRKCFPDWRARLRPHRLHHRRSLDLPHDASSRRTGCHVPDQRSLHHVHLPLHRPFLGLRLRMAICHQLADCPAVRDISCLQHHPLLARIERHQRCCMDHATSSCFACHSIFRCKGIRRGVYMLRATTVASSPFSRRGKV